MQHRRRPRQRERCAHICRVSCVRHGERHVGVRQHERQLRDAHGRIQRHHADPERIQGEEVQEELGTIVERDTDPVAGTVSRGVKSRSQGGDAAASVVIATVTAAAE